MKMCMYVVGIVTMLLLITTSSACFNPTDSFAFEVLLNKPGITYTLALFENAENVNIRDGTIIYRSHYNKEVAVIIQEIESPVKGLSVRLQVPTKFVKISHPRTTIEVKSSNQLSINEEFLKSLGYEVQGKTEKVGLKTILRKGNVDIAVWSVKTDKVYSGMHAAITNETLTPELRKEIKTIALSFGISEDEWNTARIETKSVEDVDLQALHNYLESFDFKTAIKVELEWLKNKGIVFSLTDSDIQQISQLAKAGLAGHNSRLVWENGWKPYYETSNPLLLRGISCEGFSVENLPKSGINLSQRDIENNEQSHLNSSTTFVLILLGVLSVSLIGLALRKILR